MCKENITLLYEVFYKYLSISYIPSYILSWYNCNVVKKFRNTGILRFRNYWDKKTFCRYSFNDNMNNQHCRDYVSVIKLFFVVLAELCIRLHTEDVVRLIVDQITKSLLIAASHCLCYLRGKYSFFCNGTCFT